MESHPEGEAIWRNDYDQPVTVICEMREIDGKVNFEIVESVIGISEDRSIFAE